MEGQLKVTYTIICDNDIHLELPVAEVLANEKVLAVIRREFAGGARGIVADLAKTAGTLVLEKEKKQYELTIHKDDFADALTLAEEDAKKRKLLKQGCSMVELIDLVSVEAKK